MSTPCKKRHFFDSKKSCKVISGNYCGVVAMSTHACPPSGWNKEVFNAMDVLPIPEIPQNQLEDLFQAKAATLLGLLSFIKTGGFKHFFFNPYLGK